MASRNEHARKSLAVSFLRRLQDAGVQPAGAGRNDIWMPFISVAQSLDSFDVQGFRKISM